MSEKTEIFLISLQRKTEAVQTSGTEYLQCHRSLDSAEGMTGHFQGSGELAGHSKVCPHPFFPPKAGRRGSETGSPSVASSPWPGCERHLGLISEVGHYLINWVWSPCQLPISPFWHTVPCFNKARFPASWVFVPQVLGKLFVR